MQKDFIINEVERIAYATTRLAGFKNTVNPEAFDRYADQMLQDEHDITLPALLQLSDDEFEDLLNRRNYSPDKLDALAQLLYLYYQPFVVTNETLAGLRKIVAIFNLLEQKHHRASLENMNKRDTIYQFLKENYE
ncbi:hypothetical protein LX99_00681 [Mucilaginibacter oryzae]|uniref:Uncharacterized protein n=1 Tax=Mucilaginibacter oryzae TaxID=468058 RepID=A0A316HIT1_9SPHI|nr:hypothetical protein [Mucilaginibacter oryzae]PWK80217.1 hypothetical protein LX99_00681 [Mucilaginibacter oryzae]